MSFINTFLEWLPTLIVVVAVGVNAILLVVRIMSNAESNVKEWLLLAVTEAEKALGSGTGQLKLR
ncbi:MAG: hypothetical protein NC084_12545 [Bacteroides sp.]|nr:hypothetical protein [Eubacterium sp.]MCM1417718.1 hypothetical protein [Roseburia sp.]MCM1463522.1 hypothetical protein [Bacteroides sp.]